MDVLSVRTNQWKHRRGGVFPARRQRQRLVGVSFVRTKTGRRWRRPLPTAPLLCTFYFLSTNDRDAQAPSVTATPRHLPLGWRLSAATILRYKVRYYKFTAEKRDGRPVPYNGEMKMCKGLVLPMPWVPSLFARTYGNTVGAGFSPPANRGRERQSLRLVPRHLPLHKGGYFR